MSEVATNLRTDTGCADNGEEGVGLWPHGHIDTRKQLREFVLVLVCGADCVHKYLQNTEKDRAKREDV